MKKHLTKIVFLLALIFVVFGIYIYRNVLEDKVNNVSYKTLVINDISIDSTYEIRTEKSTGETYQLELSILGNSTSIISLIISDDKSGISKEIRIKNGIIDRDFILECKNNEATIQVKTDQNATGNLKIDYRFITF